MQRLVPGPLALLLGLLLAAPACADPAPARSAIKAGDLAIETPWMRATPAGATVAGGYVRITNTGAQADRLVSASMPLAATTGIHTMSTEGGVMRMAPVEGGLAIEPGRTVELKPGGLHLMFEGLTGAPKVGEGVPGTLVFERAGTVPVVFAVAPIGALTPDAKAPEAKAPEAKAPAAGHHHH